MWKFFTGGEVKSSACPRPGSSVIYIGSHDGFVYCLNAKVNAPHIKFLVTKLGIYLNNILLGVKTDSKR